MRPSQNGLAEAKSPIREIVNLTKLKIGNHFYTHSAFKNSFGDFL